MRDTERCPGSGEAFVEKWTCRVCGRECGRNRIGRVAAHNAPAELVTAHREAYLANATAFKARLAEVEEAIISAEVGYEVWNVVDRRSGRVLATVWTTAEDAEAVRAVLVRSAARRPGEVPLEP